MTHPDEDIDLASLALQVWKSASAADQRKPLPLAAHRLGYARDP
ncbi:MAG: hypothetical protein KatS3mg040_0008 [Candidatus Kapaibacterium sp.]|nr:MAG: hypothetical protein KatS3mg040_0008 [Candidatus Kapabacteria bacterium]